MYKKDTFRAITSNLFLTSVLFMSGGFTVASAAPIHVEVDTGRSQEHGAGMSVGRGPDCFIVVPKHVVEFARSIVITDRKGRSAKALPYQEPDGVDAMLLKVESGHSLDCPEDWDDGSVGESGLSDANFLISRKVQQGGVKQRRFFLTGESSTEISVEPFSASKSNRLIEGDSGSSLYANNAIAGMIYEVDTSSGTAKAIKQSQLHALFGSLVLDKAVRRALINPVYNRYTENKYATVAVRDFMDERTPYDVIELSPTAAATNLQNARRGTEPVYPDNMDYVFTSTLIDEKYRSDVNPNYKASAASESNFGKKLLNSLGNRSARYIHVSNFDVEVRILIPSEDRQLRHIERLEYKAVLTDQTDQQTLRSEFAVQAAVDGLQAALLKYGFPVSTDEDEQAEPEKNNLLGDLLKFGKDK